MNDTDKNQQKVIIQGNEVLIEWYCSLLCDNPILMTTINPN